MIQCHMVVNAVKNSTVWWERKSGAVLDNGEQEGFFEEVVLMQGLAQGNCATKLLGTAFILYIRVGPGGMPFMLIAT